MKRIRKMLTGIIVCGGIAACGESDPASNVPEFAQNVDELTYELKEMAVEGWLERSDGSKQEIAVVLTSDDRLKQEQVALLIDQSAFFLQINGKAANINVAASRRLSSSRNASEKAGCQFEGSTEASGWAEYDLLELDYRIEASKEGSDCASSVEEKYQEFAFGELEGLHLNLISQLREAKLLDIENSEAFELRIRIDGAVSP